MSKHSKTNTKMKSTKTTQKYTKITDAKRSAQCEKMKHKKKREDLLINVAKYCGPFVVLAPTNGS